MYRRATAAVLLVLALSVPAPAWAQGNGNGNGNGNGQANSSATNGSSSNSANGDAGSAAAANAPGGGKGGQAATPSDEPRQGSDLSQSDVLEAVESGDAVSLESILPDIRNRTGGDIIDAKLQRAQGFLLYAVTVLTPAGKVLTEYYYARSGLHVESR